MGVVAPGRMGVVGPGTDAANGRRGARASLPVLHLHPLSTRRWGVEGGGRGLDGGGWEWASGSGRPGKRELVPVVRIQEGSGVRSKGKGSWRRSVCSPRGAGLTPSREVPYSAGDTYGGLVHLWRKSGPFEDGRHKGHCGRKGRGRDSDYPSTVPLSVNPEGLGVPDAVSAVAPDPSPSNTDGQAVETRTTGLVG